MKQTTLAGSFTLAGKGLHSGCQLTAEFCPAPENHGYKIQRVDLEGEPILDCLAENVVATNRGTVLARGEVKVSTIEHALAALYSLGVDNCLIKVNGPELPIINGSASPFAEAIEAAGIVELKAEREFYVVKHKLEVVDEESGSKIIILPDDEFSV